MLQLAAAACAEIRTGRRAAQRRRIQQLFDHSASVVALAFNYPYPREIAGRSLWHEDGLRAYVRQPVAAIDQLLDRDLIAFADRDRSARVILQINEFRRCCHTPFVIADCGLRVAGFSHRRSLSLQSKHLSDLCVLRWLSSAIRNPQSEI